MKHLPVVRDLECVDGFQRLRHDVNPVHTGSGEQLVLVHLPEDLGRAAAKVAEKLLAEKEERNDADLRGPKAAQGVLHRRRRRVRSTLYLEAGIELLQLLRGAPKLPVDLSGRTKLDTQRAIHFLNGGHVVVRDNVEG